jgi:hypothetical protein
MRSVVGLFGLATTLLIGLGGCGRSTSLKACTPGLAVACTCADARKGGQVCLPDGTGYAPCVCMFDDSPDAAPDAGGTGGNPDARAEAAEDRPASSDGGGEGGAADADGGAACTGPNGLCTDFPPAPIVESGASTGTCAAPSGAGPCIREPEEGSLFPRNWLRPRVSVQGAAGSLKITVHSDREANDLVVYTTDSNWKMPRDIWTALAAHVQDSPISVSVCGASGGVSTTHFTIAPAAAAGTIVYLAGNPAYVGIDAHACQPPNPLTPCLGIADLRGFAVGDETTLVLLSVDQVAQASRTDAGNTTPVTCVGCHSATPDSSFVTLVDSYPWRAATASIAGTGVLPHPSGASFPSVTPGGLAALLQPGWGPLSFSLGRSDSNPYWQPGRRIGIGALGHKDPTRPDYSNGPDQNDSPNLAWLNLEAPVARGVQPGDNSNWSYPSFTLGAGIDSGNSLGFIQHTGDSCGTVPCGAGMPSWSHDGSKIVYVSTNAAVSGHFNREVANPGPVAGNPALSATQQNANPLRQPGLTNLFTVPFNGGLGGSATPLNGAATVQREEIYPAFSPDDQYVAFTAVPAGETMYTNPNAEIFVVPASGASAAVRLRANDPPACTGKTSPGVNNHWARWSPAVTTGARRYYWMVFSSNRSDIPPFDAGAGKLVPMSQLYLAAVVIDENGAIQSYPAVYLWNQPGDRVNTLPAWETFAIPVLR